MTAAKGWNKLLKILQRQFNSQGNFKHFLGSEYFFHDLNMSFYSFMLPKYVFSQFSVLNYHSGNQKRQLLHVTNCSTQLQYILSNNIVVGTFHCQGNNSNLDSNSNLVVAMDRWLSNNPGCSEEQMPVSAVWIQSALVDS